MADNEQAKFLTGNLFRHVTTMSLTASIGLMAIFLVDLADMVFISMLGEPELAAAIGYSGAILFFTTSFSIGMSIAAGALVAQALGGGDKNLARSQATSTIVTGLVVSSIFAAIVWINLPFLSALMGASGNTLTMSVGYLQIIIPSLPLLTVGMVGSAVLRGHGDARRAMMVTLIGGAINAVLDPILIFGLDLELTGAALASVATRVGIAAAALWPIFKVYGGLDRPNFPHLMRDLAPILAIAVPGILTQLATPLGSAYVTRTMAEFGEAAVAGMAMVGRLTPVALAVVFALSGAIGPILGQNFGAGQFDRVRGAFRDGILFVAVCVLGATLVLFLLREPIAQLFGATGIARELVFLFCGPLALLFFFTGVMFVCNAAFNNLHHPYYSTWLNWGRNTLGTVPLVALGASYYGAKGVLIGQAFGGVLFALIAWILAYRVINKQENAKKPLGVPKPFVHRTRLLQLFLHRR